MFFSDSLFTSTIQLDDLFVVFFMCFREESLEAAEGKITVVKWKKISVYLCILMFYALHLSIFLDVDIPSRSK